MIKPILAGAVVFGLSTAASAMPGAFLASADDIIAIIYNKDVANKLGSDIEISAVARVNGNRFVISAADCKLGVKVIRVQDPNEPTPMIPARAVELGELVCNDR